MCTTVGFPLSYFNYDRRSWGFETSPLQRLPLEVYQKYLAKFLDAPSFCRLSSTCRELSRREIDTFKRVPELVANLCLTALFKSNHHRRQANAFMDLLGVTSFSIPLIKVERHFPPVAMAAAGSPPPPDPDWLAFIRGVKSIENIAKPLIPKIRLPSDYLSRHEETFIQMRDNFPIIKLINADVQFQHHNLNLNLPPIDPALFLQPETERSLVDRVVDKVTSTVKYLFSLL